MTTTPELHELAKDPQAFDTIMAALSDRMGDYMRKVAASTARLHELAGDRKSYRNTRVPVWGLSDLEAEREAQRKAAHGDQSSRVILSDRAGSQAMLDAINFELANMNAVYLRQGNRWTRFFPSVTKSQPHIHRSLNCHTLHATTVMTWAPQLSGRTDAEAVDELDEALCSVCFPGAPVALHNYVSRRSQEQVAARAAEKQDRDDRLAAKRLDPQTEQFRTEYGHDMVTTVAGCKEVIRKAVDQAVEVEYYADDEHMTAKMGWADADRVAEFRTHADRTLAKMQADARQAQAVLIDREQAHPGWGMTADAIVLMENRKERQTRKDWGI